MVLNSVNSSNISQIGYDPDLKILIIKFKNGSMYEYLNVPLVTYTNFSKSESIGKFFISNIKNNFQYKIISK